jgi:hypothetical protein
MNEKKTRREFFVLSSLAAINCELLAAQGQETVHSSKVPADPTPAELTTIHGSAVAQNLVHFFGKGYSCAESGLACCLRFLEKPDELVWVAGGFGGGLGQKDLCGFLTSGIMAIGLYCGTLALEREESMKICSELSKKYWLWWQEKTPLHCSQIREGHYDERVCVRIGYLAMAKVEEILTQHKQNV